MTVNAASSKRRPQQPQGGILRKKKGVGRKLERKSQLPAGAPSRFLANKQSIFKSADGKTAIFGTYHETDLPQNASRSANMVKCNYA